jgi:hypothetical protein
MTEILPLLGKYKYDTWRILPVKCYVDNSMRLWSCIRNVNNHFWRRCRGGSQYLLSENRLHRIIGASIFYLSCRFICFPVFGCVLRREDFVRTRATSDPPLLLEVYIEILFDRTSGSSLLTSSREEQPQKSEDELQATCKWIHCWSMGALTPLCGRPPSCKNRRLGFYPRVLLWVVSRSQRTHR